MRHDAQLDLRVVGGHQHRAAAHQAVLEARLDWSGLPVTIGTITMGIENGLITPRTPGRLAIETPAGKVDIEGGLVDVAARAPGIIKEVYVQEGDVVKKDQILARQEDDEPRVLEDRRQRAAVAAYREGFALGNYGLASAAAVVLFGVLLVFSIAYVRLIGREGEL